MALSDYQKKIDGWVGQHGGYWTPHESLARITEEVGELARLINHLYGPKRKKSEEAAQDLAEEMADIIWAIGCLANSLGVDLDEAFEKVLDKAHNRDSGRFTKK